MHHFFEVADQSQHGKDRLYLHSLIPLAPAAELEVGRVPFGRVEGGITEDHHLILEPFQQVVEMGVVNVGGVFSASPSLVFGSRECEDGSTVPVVLGSATVTLTDSDPDPSRAESALGVYGIARGTCSGITLSSTSTRRGTYRVRGDSIFFAWDTDADPYTRSAAWLDGRRFRSLVHYDGLDVAVVFAR